MSNTDPNSSPVFAFKTKGEADVFRKSIACMGLHWCGPIYWHDSAEPFPKLIKGASCFFLKFINRYIGVTAAHVIRQFEAAARETPSSVCQIHVMPFDLASTIIAINDDLDIATFAISERELKTVEAIPFDVSVDWPPAM